MKPISKLNIERRSDQFFKDMHRDLRAKISSVPESPERLDPAMRMLMQLFAHRLAELSSRIDETWERARGDLIRSIVPDVKRWPVPAFTVLSCEPVDSAVIVDPDTRFYYKEEREGGQRYFFSSARNAKMLAARLSYAVLQQGEQLKVLRTPDSGSDAGTYSTEATFLNSGVSRLYLGWDHQGLPSDFLGVSLFMKGGRPSVKTMHWSTWYPGTRQGSFQKAMGFCPGLTTSSNEMFGAKNWSGRDWGGLRTTDDVLAGFNEHWATLPDAFVAGWEKSPLPGELEETAKRSGISALNDNNEYYWIRLDIESNSGSSSPFKFPEVRANCCIALNKHEVVTTSHTAGNVLFEVELPDHVDNIVEIIRVSADGGDEFRPRESAAGEAPEHTYSLERRGDRMLLWFDYSNSVQPPPNSIHVVYTITSGTAANGIAEGKINSLYEKHPGIVSVTNVHPVLGAVPAKTDEQMTEEATLRLRNRDRALTFAEVSRWVRSYDRRINAAECRSGIQRATGGLRRCVIVALNVSQEDFSSADELRLIQERILAYLHQRSPVNTHYQIEIVLK